MAKEEIVFKNNVSSTSKKSVKHRRRDLEVMNKITSKSKLTKKDVEGIVSKIDRAVAKKFNSLS